MSLDVDGFHQEIQSSNVTIAITEQHPLIRLAKSLPWEGLFVLILPDLQRSEKLLWWIGRPLRLCIHLGIYLLQQLFDLTNRQAEYSLYDNATFRLFCGYGIMKK